MALKVFHRRGLQVICKVISGRKHYAQFATVIQTEICWSSVYRMGAYWVRSYS